MLQNLIMVFLRETNNLERTDLANTLGISLSEYIDFEEGKVFLTDGIIVKLALFYKTRDKYFSESSLQNELFKSREDFISGLLEKMQAFQQQIGCNTNAEAEVSSNPYEVISHFFALGIIDTTRKVLHDWFEAAFDKDSCWQHEPTFLIFQYKRIINLIDAAYVLYMKKYKTNEQYKADYSRNSFPDNPLERIKLIEAKMNDWNDFPYLLNCNEWEDPYYVFKDFFDYLHLHEWKAELNLWLQAGLFKQTICSIAKPERLLPVCLHLQKLVEAAHLINLMELSGENQNEIDKVNAENITEDDDDQEPLRFNKPERLIDKINKDPQDCIKETFLLFDLNNISHEIHQWTQLALANDESAYEEGQAREDLMDFCDELQLLVESFHVMNESNKPANADEWKKKIPDDLRERIDKLNQTELLNMEQTANPMLVVNAFCNKFSLSYVRAELWDMLDAVIGYSGEKESHKKNILLAYQCISCFVEVAYIIHENKE